MTRTRSGVRESEENSAWLEGKRFLCTGQCIQAMSSMAPERLKAVFRAPSAGGFRLLVAALRSDVPAGSFFLGEK